MYQPLEIYLAPPERARFEVLASKTDKSARQLLRKIVEELLVGNAVQMLPSGKLIIYAE